jgi:hypothetical protein
MKTSELAAPDESRIQRASDEAFRVLSGNEADQSAEGRVGCIELESSSPIAEQALRILRGDETDWPGQGEVDAAELGHTTSSEPALNGGSRFPAGNETDRSAGERLINSQSAYSFSDQPDPFVQSRQRFGVLTIIAAALVSFGVGVLAPQLFSETGDDPAAAGNATETAFWLKHERQRTGQLTTELAAVRREFEAQLKFSSDAIDETAQLKKSMKAVTAELELERQKNAELMHRLESIPPSIIACDAPDCAANVQRKSSVGPDNHPSTPEAKMDPELVRLMTRANDLLAQGNISGARMVLERAVEMGSARANFTMAETYDPGILAGWKTYGTRGDPAKAREFYARAAAAGIEEANDRIASLGRK